jgi:hypothetical protein
MFGGLLVVRTIYRGAWFKFSSCGFQTAHYAESGTGTLCTWYLHSPPDGFLLWFRRTYWAASIIQDDICRYRYVGIADHTYRPRDFRDIPHRGCGMHS